MKSVSMPLNLNHHWTILCTFSVEWLIAPGNDQAREMTGPFLSLHSAQWSHFIFRPLGACNTSLRAYEIKFESNLGCTAKNS